MKIPYFCCIGAELKRYEKDFDFMNQVYLYKIPADDTLEEVLAQDYFLAIADTVLQDDLLYIYEPTAQVLHTCRFNKQGGHITAVQLTNNVPELTPNRVLISDASGHITAGDVTLEYLKNKVDLDGTSIMTGPLKMRSSVSFKCAIAPSWDGVGFYKLNDNDSLTLMASMESTEGLTPAADNTYNIGKSNKRWKDLYIARVITGVLNNGANIEIPTKAGTIALESDIGRTNCITEIPQDLKIEISSGTFTLKAGSKVYVPNGAGVFDSYTLPSDKTVTPSAFSTSSNRFVIISPSKNLDMVDVIADYIYSGTTAPTTFDGNGKAYWYDTTNNVIKRTQDSGTTWLSGYSFPIAIVDITNGVGVSKIDQVFNGFGYIGSTVFALPGVKGLIPNGRNADGTLKNTSFTINNVLTTTDTSGATGALEYYINGSGVYRANLGAYIYDEKDNYWKYNGVNQSFILLDANAYRTSGKVSSFNPKFAFQALDYNDSDYIAHQAMPSGTYTDLSLGTSGSTYTAPADGYFYLRKAGTATNQYIYMGGNGLSQDVFCPLSNGGTRSIWLPVKKGAVVTISYNADGSVTSFRFIYAVGAR